MNFSFKDKILIIAAHPDDETLGCGGTIAKAVINKANVKVIFIGEGVSARFPIGSELSDISIKHNKIRENEAKKALKILRIKNYSFGKKFCTKFDNYLLTEIVQEIENNIKNFLPNIIFTHTDKDLNIDHGIVHKAVMTACRPKFKNSIKKIYSFEVPCSSNWTYNGNFNPNTFVDISKSIEIKQKAFKAYKNENRPFPFPRSEIGIDTLAKFRGMQSGLKYAEAFRLEREIFS
jgi:LmbE family N-acetylglucosaminyl deacetylase